MPAFPRRNNLEWLRLIFAIQVVFTHSSFYFKYRLPEAVGHLPGVPAFFFVRGFSIYSSYRNAPGRRYFENRFLRLYPALVFATLGGMVVTIIAHGWGYMLLNAKTYAVWVVSQTTLGQAYNPSIFRDVGSGVVNGSLWTLTVEILFYLCVPVIVWTESKFRLAVPVWMSLSFAVYAIGQLVLTEKIGGGKSIYDFIALTPLAWGWMFGFGILAVKNFGFLRPWLKFAPVMILPMMAMILWGGGGDAFFGSRDGGMGLLYFVCYVSLVMWFAFAAPYVRLPFDISYGVYVWHMPVINLLMVLTFPSAILAFALTFTMAIVSCFLVERPALELKQVSQKRVSGVFVT